MKKLSAILAVIGPGLFLVGYNIGTGSITTMAATGAEYGMVLVWPLLLSCIFTFFLIIAFGRYTAVTGETALYSFKKHFGQGVARFVLFTLLLSEYASSMGVMAIVTQTVQEWSRPLTSSGEGFNTVAMTFLFVGILYAIFWNGVYRIFEKILALFVGLMGISFVLTMFMVEPDPAEIIAGLVPRIPKGSNAPLLIAGMVGTTMGGVLYVVRSILVKEKGWTAADLRIERRDAFLSVIVMFVLSVAIMASAAGTLHPRGLLVENAIDMVRLLEPLAGRFAISVFVAGIVCAGLSSLFPIAILGPWLLADYNNTPRNLQSVQSRIFVASVLALGFVVPIFGGRPVLVMIVSQALLTLATPLIIILMVILLNRDSIMGEYRPTVAMNVMLGIVFAFSVAMAGIGVVGLASL
ncbi:MAG TPA: Nramp family divalent metal transporter [Rhodothermales bacterium]|nr:Nramp family divalent metal transporter [Rhodothermales bacterium]